MEHPKSSQPNPDLRPNGTPCIKAVIEYPKRATNIRVPLPMQTIDDIDLYTGGLAEVPSKGAVVGPTFACLIGRQMFYYKSGRQFNRHFGLWAMFWAYFLQFVGQLFEQAVHRHSSSSYICPFQESFWGHFGANFWSTFKVY